MTFISSREIEKEFWFAGAPRLKLPTVATAPDLALASRWALAWTEFNGLEPAAVEMTVWIAAEVETVVESTTAGNATPEEASFVPVEGPALPDPLTLSAEAEFVLEDIVAEEINGLPATSDGVIVTVAKLVDVPPMNSAF